MRNLLLGFAILLSGCGIKVDDQALPGLTCATNPAILLAGETTSMKFDRPSASSAFIEKYLEVGDTLSFLDWGSISSTTEETRVDYVAPVFVPETRKIGVVGSSAGVGPGTCNVYLLQTGHVGVAEDGVADGVTATVYDYPGATAALPNLGSLTALNQAVVRNLDFNNVGANTLIGLTGQTANYAILYRGRVIAPTTNTYRFRITASKIGRLTIGSGSVNSTGAAANLDVALTAGESYAFEVLHVQTTGNITLRLDWAAASAPNTFPAGTIIPYTAIDRP